MANDAQPASDESGSLEVVSEPGGKRRSGYVMSRVLSHPLTRSFGKNGKLSIAQTGLVGVSVALALEEAHERESNRDAFKLLSFTWLTDRMSRSRGESVVVVNGGAPSIPAEEKKSKRFWDAGTWVAIATVMGIGILGFALWVTHESAGWKSLAESRSQTITDLKSDKTSLQEQNSDLQSDIRELQSAALQLIAVQKEEDRKALTEKIDRIVRTAIRDENKKEKKKEVASNKGEGKSDTPSSPNAN